MHTLALLRLPFPFNLAFPLLYLSRIEARTRRNDPGLIFTIYYGIPMLAFNTISAFPGLNWSIIREKAMPKLSMNLDLGHAITIAVMLLGFAVGWGKLEARSETILALEKKLEATDLSLQQTREKMIEMSARIEDYRRLPCADK